MPGRLWVSHPLMLSPSCAVSAVLQPHRAEEKISTWWLKGYHNGLLTTRHQRQSIVEGLKTNAHLGIHRWQTELRLSRLETCVPFPMDFGGIDTPAETLSCQQLRRPQLLADAFALSLLLMHLYIARSQVDLVLVQVTRLASLSI
ncbi:hypothetical protein BJ170DRAFT_114719 [Xylariales sp. AK1849]|nr:hypothetical protein BJ170DRAFT_114719 [Xylariales sp. AK1849]